MGLQGYEKVFNENWNWYKFSDVMTLKGHSQGQQVMLKVNFKKCSEWPEYSSEMSGYVKMQILSLAYK